MLGILLSGYLAICIVICFIRIKWGIAMFLLYSILVPHIAFFSFGKNVFPFLIIIALFFNYGVKDLYYKALLPFLFLYLGEMLLLPLHDDLSLGYQLNYLRSDLMGTLLLPFAILNVMKKDPKAFSLFTNTLIIAIAIASVYTLYLASIPGANPYLMVISPLSGGEFNEDYASVENAGRVFGRISGVFGHPMTNGLFLSLSLVYIGHRLLSTYLKKEKIFYGILIAILLFAILFIGVRTAIAACAIGCLSFIFLNRKFNLLIYAAVGVGAIMFIISQIPGMENFITSMFDSGNKSEVGGSSLDMRLAQFDGAINEIRYNPLFGHGSGWTTYYKEFRGVHPVLLAFESLLFIVLCNSGFVGVFIWILMLIFYSKLVNVNFETQHTNVLMVLMIVYVSYAMITGEYGYMKYFLIFYSVLWADGKISYRFKINKLKKRILFKMYARNVRESFG